MRGAGEGQFHAATLGDDGTVKLWGLPGWTRLDVLEFGDGLERPRSVAFVGKSLLVGLSNGPILRFLNILKQGTEL